MHIIMLFYPLLIIQSVKSARSISWRSALPMGHLSLCQTLLCQGQIMTSDKPSGPYSWMVG